MQGEHQTKAHGERSKLATHAVMHGSHARLPDHLRREGAVPRALRAVLALAGASALVVGCAAGGPFEVFGVFGAGLSVAGTGSHPRLVPGTPEYRYWHENDNAPASMEVKLVKKGRAVQSSCGSFYVIQGLCGPFYEVRAMYTEALVRSAANRTDYHVGLMARPNSLLGYSLNIPAPGTPAGQGVPRLRYARHTVADDPLFPSLVDRTRTINPTNDGAVYFLGQGILATAQADGFPPTVLDAFDPEIPSRVVGSAEDEPSIKLGMNAAENLFGTVWNSGVYYTEAGATRSLAPTVVDRPLTDNTNLVPTRYYKWKFPFAATSFTLGHGMPLGRLILDIRVVEASGTITDSGSTQVLLQNGANVLTVTLSTDKQDLSSNLDLALPK